MFINSINYLIILWFILYGTASGPGELSTALGGGWITLKTKCQVGVRPQPTPRLQRWLGQTRKNRVRELTCYKPHRNAHLFTMYSGLPSPLPCLVSARASWYSVCLRSAEKRLNAPWGIVGLTGSPSSRSGRMDSYSHYFWLVALVEDSVLHGHCETKVMSNPPVLTGGVILNILLVIFVILFWCNIILIVIKM